MKFIKNNLFKINVTVSKKASVEAETSTLILKRLFLMNFII